jgi:hypothetical protein
MRYGGSRMVKQHPGTGIAHNLFHAFFHCRTIAVYGAKPASWFGISERTSGKSAVGIFQQLAAFRAQLFVLLFPFAIETNHLFHGFLFLFNPGVSHYC